MNDRELLELSAKAAGYDTTHRMNAERLQMIPPVDSLLIRDSAGEIRHTAWNPLANNGDALRLAVTLGLTVECDFHDSDTCTAYQTRGEIVADEQSGMTGEIIGSPEFAATRRAIVRAAAEIGRSMQ